MDVCLYRGHPKHVCAVCVCGGGGGARVGVHVWWEGSTRAGLVNDRRGYQGVCSDCEAYGLKKHGLTRSDFTHTLYHIYLTIYKVLCPYAWNLDGKPLPCISQERQISPHLCLTYTESGNGIIPADIHLPPPRIKLKKPANAPGFSIRSEN